MEQVGTLKAFYDVFPTLRVDEDMQMLFGDVGVRKVTTNPERDFLHIHIFSRHVIQKRHVWAMELKVKEQLFGTANIKIRIIERYALSEQYTPAALMAEYKNSIVLELKKISVLAANMFQQAEITFDGPVMCLELTDTIVSSGRKEQIVNLLEDIYQNRFGIQTDIRVIYKQKEESKTREYDEQRVQREIDAIFARNKKAHEEVEVHGEEAAERNTEKKQARGTESLVKREAPKEGGTVSGKRRAGEKAGGNGKKGFKKDFVRPLKQGDDPSLIYGRNFDDEPIRLDQVVTEMGEITVHGKIISFETREIRNEKSIIMFAVSDFTDTIMVKMFARNDQLTELLGDLKKGAYVKKIGRASRRERV